MRTKKVLIVDDEQDVLLYFATLFKDNGFETLTAENGAVAYELAKNEAPDLITLDITMPEQSGIKTYQILKSDQSTEHIPIIIITAIGDSIQGVMEELSAFPEPKVFLSKPIDQTELINQAQASILQEV